MCFAAEDLCTNLIRSVVHELGISRDLADISLQVATLDIGSLKAPVERLAFGLVVADEVELLGTGVGLRVVGRGLDLFPCGFGAVWVECADVYAGQWIDDLTMARLNDLRCEYLQDVPLLVMANSLLSPTRFSETVGS